MNKNLMKMLNSNLILLPTPINISYWWNYGSLLGLFMIIQLISGLVLSMHYCPNVSQAFDSIIHIMQNINKGWLVHNIHINGASMFFICMYIHIGRGMYYHSFNLTKTWMIGITIYLVSMITAFLGYVLPWGQMSFWGATVITNLITTIPYMGTMILEWLWGGFSISNATLNRFFSFHFILPFMILMLIMLHLIMLHETGSKNPLGINSNFNKIPFHLYFTIKDLMLYGLFMISFMTLNLIYPYMFTDPDNFTQANPLVTPPHIQPEWYFLFAYTILRAMPNKLGGVLALISSILILYSYLFVHYKMKTNKFYPINQIMFWLFVNNFIILTFLGAQMIEYPYINISQFLTVTYFTYFISNHYMHKFWDFIIFMKNN